MLKRPCDKCHGEGYYRVWEEVCMLWLRLICECPAGNKHRKEARKALPPYRHPEIRFEK